MATKGPRLLPHGKAKGSTRIRYKGLRDDDLAIFISDSEDDEELSEDCKDIVRRNDKEMLRDGPFFHKLNEGAFEWLQTWCLQNVQRIERQRILEKEANQPEIRRLRWELDDVDNDIERLERQLRERKAKKQKIKRQILVFGEEEPLISDSPSSLTLEKKLFVFCKAMAEPQHTEFSRLKYGLVQSQRELVRTIHQVMSAMRVLNEDLVVAPKRLDKKFKPRQPHPGKWQILQETRSGNGNSIVEEGYSTSMKELREVCMALQNLHYAYQNDQLS